MNSYELGLCDTCSADTEPSIWYHISRLSYYMNMIHLLTW